MKILAIGEIMVEMSHLRKNQYLQKFAGDTFNMAYYARKAAPKTWKIDYLTSLGNDSFSEQIFDFIEDSGIGIQKIKRERHHIVGLFVLQNEADGEKKYTYWREQSAAKKLFDQFQNLTDYDWVYFSGITAAITNHKKNLQSSIQHAQKNGSSITYDVNHRHQLWSVKEAVIFSQTVFPYCKMIKISSEELKVLFPRMDPSILSRRYPNAEWIFTCGEKGSQTWENGILKGSVEAEPVKQIVDTSAAGDCFMGVYLISRLLKQDITTALRHSGKAAAQILSEKGSIIDLDQKIFQIDQ